MVEKKAPLPQRCFEKDGKVYVEVTVDAFNKLRRLATKKELARIRPEKLIELPPEKEEAPPVQEEATEPKVLPKKMGRPTGAKGKRVSEDIGVPE